jgi:putative addiction module CopG family antidote
MEVWLTPELERFVARKVESGRYSSLSEVLNEAVRLLEEFDQLRDSKLANLIHKVPNRHTHVDARGQEPLTKDVCDQFFLKRYRAHEIPPISGAGVYAFFVIDPQGFGLCPF